MRHLVVLALLFAGCATDLPGSDHDEPSDFEVDPGDGKADGVAATFDEDNVVDDALFEHGDAMGASDVQAFFEATPYHNRSWLADAQIDGAPASQFIVDVAHQSGVHPLVLIARMQVETSIVSKTVKPSQYRLDRALGCACPDGGTCGSGYKGLGPQLTCGAETLRKWFDASVDGTGQWRIDHSRKTLDGKQVTPENHATASLYAYTPWVLVGSGGTWLAWNVTRKYVRYADANGLTHDTTP